MRYLYSTDESKIKPIGSTKKIKMLMVVKDKNKISIKGDQMISDLDTFSLEE